MVLLCGIASASSVLGQSDIPKTFLDTVSDGQAYKAFQFETDEFLSYRIQASQDLNSWSDLATFHGFNETIVFPFAPISQNGQPTNTPEENPNPPVTLSLARALGGGTVMTWNSLSDQYPRKLHLPGITLGAHWDSAPFFHHATELYTYFIISPSGTVPVPVNAPALSIEDIWFEANFSNSDFTVIDGAIQNAPPANNALPPYPAGNGSFFRVTAEVADEDRDGLPDETEQKPTSEEGTDTDHQNPDTDGDGIWDGAEVAQGSDPKDPQSKPTDTAPDYPPNTENGGQNAPPNTGGIISIGFHGNHELTSDDQKTNYTDPQWVAGSHNFPVSYSRTKPVELSGKFIVNGANIYNVDVSASLPNKVLLHRTPLDRDGAENAWTLARTAGQGGTPEAPLPKNIADTIEFYNAKPNPGEESYDITWTLYINGGAGVPAGTTKHTMYVTHGVPLLATPTESIEQQEIRQETFFYHSCKNTNDKVIDANLTKEGIAELIYAEFLDRDVRRVIPTQGNLRQGIAEQMSYWGDLNNDGLPDAAGCKGSPIEMVASQEGNGTCEAWAAFFSDMIRIHGWNSSTVVLSPIAPNDSFTIKNAQTLINPTADANNGGYDWIRLNPANPLGEGHFIDLIPNTLKGLPAQGDDRFPTADPLKTFNTHFLSGLGNHWFDPSYGNPSLSDPLVADRLKKYENLYVEYYGKSIENGDRRFKKNNLNGDAELKAN